jgi:transposase InsO family protein
LGFYKFIQKHDIFGVGKHNEHYVPKPYITPTMIGQKMQLDIKFVPTECLQGQALKDFVQDGVRYYQYTFIDECSRERFLWWTNERSGYETAKAIRRAIVHFGYIPKIIQTDNGLEFTNPKGTDQSKVHYADFVMNYYNIEHKLIRAYTPRHNGKVERSHRNDQARFYNITKFSSLEDLRNKGRDYLVRSNNIPSSALTSEDGKRKWLSPNQKREEMIALSKFKKEIEKDMSVLKLTYSA